MTTIIEQKDGRLLLNGKLNFATVVPVRELGMSFIDGFLQSTIVFDFSEAVISDNAALALFTAWLRYAASKGKKIRFANIPQQLQDMLELTGLNAIIQIEKK
ncbi:MAG: STAS domain-containing protein [Gammaproteobacteria bacterium]|nr:STAS domain-containing protein [Gammaproteobacteria bacterium]